MGLFWFANRKRFSHLLVDAQLPSEGGEWKSSGECFRASYAEKFLSSYTDWHIMMRYPSVGWLG